MLEPLIGFLLGVAATIVTQRYLWLWQRERDIKYMAYEQTVEAVAEVWNYAERLRTLTEQADPATVAEFVDRHQAANINFTKCQFLASAYFPGEISDYYNDLAKKYFKPSDDSGMVDWWDFQRLVEMMRAEILRPVSFKELFK